MGGCFSAPPPPPPTLTDVLAMLRDSRRMLAGRAAALHETKGARDADIARLQHAQAPSSVAQLRGYLRRRVTFARMAQRFDDAVTTVESQIEVLANVSTLRHVTGSLQCAASHMRATPAVTVLSMSSAAATTADVLQRALQVQESLHALVQGGDQQTGVEADDDDLELLDNLHAALRALPSVPMHEPAAAAVEARRRRDDDDAYAIKMPQHA